MQKRRSISLSVFFITFLGIVIPSFLFAQVPTVQDCGAAIPICKNTYSTVVSYYGMGNYPNEVNLNNCLYLGGEANSVWYTFTVQTSGKFSFVLTPNTASDDYDWGVFNMTNANCSDISSNSNLLVSCNASGNTGPTGASSARGGTSNSNGPNYTNKWNADIPVLAGETYVIMVSNWSNGAPGYTIDFSGSTAVIFDNVPPKIKQIKNTVSCGTNALVFDFTENILCNTIAPCDLSISGPGGPYTITSISGANCSLGGSEENTFSVQFTPAITTGGNYTLNLNANSCGSVTDLCGNVATSGSISFTINTATLNTATTPSSCTQSNGSASVLAVGGSGGFTYQWNTNPIQTTASIGNLSPGIYSVTVTESNGCKSIKSATIVTNPVPVVSINPQAPLPFCVGGSVKLTANGANTYVWSPAIGLNTATGNTVTAAPALSQTYSVVGTSLGCSDTAVVTVTVNPYPVVQINPSNPAPFCDGDSVLLSASGASSYQWLPSNGLHNMSAAQTLASPTQTQMYQVIGTQAGCTDTAFVTLSVLPSPVSNAGADVSFCSADTVTLGAPPIASYLYNWSPAAGLDDIHAANPQCTYNNLNPIPIQLQYVLTTSLGTCSRKDTINISVNPYPIAHAGADATICSGSSLVLGDIPVAGYNYLWSPSNGLNVPSTAKPIFTLQNFTANAIDYLYSVKTTQYNCSAFDTVKITVKPAIQANAGNDVTICSGGSASLGAAADPGYAYSWSPATGLNSASVSNPTVSIVNNGNTTTFQMYTLTKSLNNCTGTDSVYVVVRPLPKTNAGSDVTICSHSTVQLGASPISGYTYTWSPADSLNNIHLANPVFSYTNADRVVKVKNYILTATALGCSYADTIQVGIYPIPLVHAGSDTTICSGGFASIGAMPHAGYTYLWSPALGLSDSTLSNPQMSLNNDTNLPMVKTYTLQAFYQGCSSADQVKITVNNIPTAQAGMDIQLCSGSSASIGAAPLPGLAYQWSPGKWLSDSLMSNPNVMMTNVGSSPYVQTFYLLSRQGVCVNQDTISINVNPIPKSIAGRDSFMCSSASLNLGSASVVGCRYQWFPSTGLNNDTISNPLFTLQNSSSAIIKRDYILTTTQYACSAKDTVSIDVFYALNAHFTATPDTLCAGEKALIQYTGNASDSAKYSWNWASGNLISGAGKGPFLVSWLQAGLHVLHLLVEERNCFSPIDSVPVFIHPIPLVDAGANMVLCSDASAILGQAANPNYSYHWWPSAGLQNDTLANPIVSIHHVKDSSFTQAFVLTVSANNCSAKDTVLVTVFPNPQAAIKPLLGQCLSSNHFDFSAVGNWPYQPAFSWDFDSTANILHSALQNPSAIVFTDTGYHSVSLTVSQMGCVGKSYIDSVLVYPMPIVNFSSDEVRGCAPLSIYFTNHSTDAGLCLWSFGDSSHSNQCQTQHLFGQAGNYDVTLNVTSKQGCSSQLTKPRMIHVYPLPQAICHVEPATTSIFHPEIHFENRSPSSVKCLWNFGDHSTSDSCSLTHAYADTGFYNIELLVVNQYGCKDTTDCSVYVQPEFTFYVPDAFTPDHDGINDTFHGSGIGYHTYSLLIFNRWGNEIYKADDDMHPWDGTLNAGKVEAEMGVYIYKIDLKDDLGKFHHFIGRVSLIR